MRQLIAPVREAPTRPVETPLPRGDFDHSVPEHGGPDDQRGVDRGLEADREAGGEGKALDRR